MTRGERARAAHPRPGRARGTAPFSGSPRATVDERSGGGHNLRLGHAAAAHDRKAPACAEVRASARTRPRVHADDGSGTGAFTDPTGE
ncbi:hypothetical protein [Actinomadura sediminis]|uniref:Uncharacterized protein n=1 Tax=Actinomadura sediminis TaxID=1038904 RepID=A0ABW3ENK5_9ACTN